MDLEFVKVLCPTHGHQIVDVGTESCPERRQDNIRNIKFLAYLTNNWCKLWVMDLRGKIPFGERRA